MTEQQIEPRILRVRVESTSSRSEKTGYVVIDHLTETGEEVRVMVGLDSDGKYTHGSDAVPQNGYADRANEGVLVWPLPVAERLASALDLGTAPEPRPDLVFTVFSSTGAQAETIRTSSAGELMADGDGVHVLDDEVTVAWLNPAQTRSVVRHDSIERPGLTEAQANRILALYAEAKSAEEDSPEAHDAAEVRFTDYVESLVR